MRYVDLPPDPSDATDTMSHMYDVCRSYAADMLHQAHFAYQKGLTPTTPYVRDECECALHELVWDAHQQGRQDALRTRITLDRTVDSVCLDCGATGQGECPRCEGKRMGGQVKVTCLTPNPPTIVDGEAWGVDHTVLLRDRDTLEDDLEGEGYLICDT